MTPLKRAFRSTLVQQVSNSSRCHSPLSWSICIALSVLTVDSLNGAPADPWHDIPPPQKATDRTTISPEEIIKVVREDASHLPPSDVSQYRYITIHNVQNW